MAIHKITTFFLLPKLLSEFCMMPLLHESPCMIDTHDNLFTYSRPFLSSVVSTHCSPYLMQDESSTWLRKWKGEGFISYYQVQLLGRFSWLGENVNSIEAFAFSSTDIQVLVAVNWLSSKSSYFLANFHCLILKIIRLCFYKAPRWAETLVDLRLFSDKDLSHEERDSCFMCYPGIR